MKGERQVSTSLEKADRFPSTLTALALLPSSFTALTGYGDEWVEYWDEAAQATYYFNLKTHEASWTRPGHTFATAGAGYDTGTTTAAGATTASPYGTAGGQSYLHPGAMVPGSGTAMMMGAAGERRMTTFEDSPLLQIFLRR